MHIKALIDTGVVKSFQNNIKVFPIFFFNFQNFYFYNELWTLINTYSAVQIYYNKKNGFREIFSKTMFHML